MRHARREIRGATRVEVLLTIISVTLLGILAALVVPREVATDEARAPDPAPAPAPETGDVSLTQEELEQFAAMVAELRDVSRVVERFVGRDSEVDAATRSRRADEAALASNVATIRMALEMYAVQHDDTWPDDPAVQLTTTTDREGGPGTEYGPYLRNTFPENPVNGRREVRVVDTMPEAPVGEEGWIYALDTGVLRANVAGVGPSGGAYFEL